MNRRLVFVAAPLMAVAVGTSAFGAWKANAPSGSASSKALTVPQVSGVNAADGTGSSVITWTAVTAAQFSPGVTGYKVVRYTNSTGATGATTICANASSATCTDSSGTTGTFWYGVSARYAPSGVSWTGAESTRDQAVVSAAGPTLTINDSAGSGHRDIFSGTTTFKASTPANNPVTIKVYSGASATGTAVKTYTATPTGGSSPFSWTFTTPNGDLTAGSQYTAQASQTDGSGNASNQPTVTFNAQ